MKTMNTASFVTIGLALLLTGCPKPPLKLAPDALPEGEVGKPYHAEITIAGKGEDKIGPFTLEGALDLTSSEGRLRKRYVGAHSVLYAGTFFGGILRGIWTFPRSDRRGLFLLGHEELVPRAAESIFGGVPSIVALWTVPLRLPSVLRQQELARRFVEDHSELRAWLDREPK